MRTRPLLESRPAVTQVFLATMPAFVLGILAGVVLDLSAIVYLVVLIASVLGGVLAGFEHRGAIEGGERGLVGGLVWGVGVVLGHNLLSRRATWAMPHPEGLEVVLTAIVGIPLGAIGGVVRARRADSEHRTEPVV